MGAKKRRGRPLGESKGPIDDALQKMMKRAGISTFRQLATKATVTYVALHYYRNGQRTPGIEATSRLAQALNVSTDKIIEMFTKV